MHICVFGHSRVHSGIEFLHHHSAVRPIFASASAAHSAVVCRRGIVLRLDFELVRDCIIVAALNADLINKYRHIGIHTVQHELRDFILINQHLDVDRHQFVFRLRFQVVAELDCRHEISIRINVTIFKECFKLRVGHSGTFVLFEVRRGCHRIHAQKGFIGACFRSLHRNHPIFRIFETDGFFGFRHRASSSSHAAAARVRAAEQIRSVIGDIHFKNTLNHSVVRAFAMFVHFRDGIQKNIVHPNVFLNNQDFPCRIRFAGSGGFIQKIESITHLRTIGFIPNDRPFRRQSTFIRRSFRGRDGHIAAHSVVGQFRDVNSVAFHKVARLRFANVNSVRVGDVRRERIFGFI